MKLKGFKSKCMINKVGITRDTLTGRGGMVLYARYLSEVNIYPLLEGLFGELRKSKKGLVVWKIFKQIFCWFYDETSRHLVYFDQVKKDEGYGAVLENSREEMISSHQVKRFFRSFSWVSGGIFRKVLKQMFVWRLKKEQPEIIELTVDTMVMNNDEAQKRHGVQPTYKNKKGFQPLQVIWNGKIVDAIFRGGKKHGNSGSTVIHMISELVGLIRKDYSPCVSIILRLDSAFFDQKNLRVFDELGIGFICSGKVYREVKEYVKAQPSKEWQRYDKDEQGWEYIEYGYRCASWDRFCRAVYTRMRREEGGQLLFEFARPDSLIVTNIGVSSRVFEHSSAAKRREYLQAKSIIESHHQRGADELPHRGLKDFGFEELPFKRFAANMSFYYCMLISFFLFETFKEDVLEEVLPVGSYASTVRRRVLDVAAKVVKTGGEIILKVTHVVMEGLRFNELWQRCQDPIPIII